MDSARFIRNRTIFIAWFATPLILVVLLDRGALGYQSRQQLACIRNQTLAKVIPQMTQVKDKFDHFIQPYKPSNDPAMSIQDQTIQQINKAAGETLLKLTSINLKENNVENTPGTIRILMLIKATGTTREITTFLNQLKNSDPQIYEHRIKIKNNNREEEQFQLEAELSKVYLEPGRYTP